MRILLIFAALAACNDTTTTRSSEYGVLRMKLFQQCMAQPNADADDCSDSSFYVANTCDDTARCLREFENVVPRQNR